MAQVTLRVFDGYPDSWGTQRAAVFPHYGPTSYVQAVLAAATIPTGGDTVLATEAGMKYFDKVEGGLTDDAIFMVRAMPLTPSAPQPAGPGPSYGLQWIANKTGTFGGQAQTAGSEAAAGTDLSLYLVRLLGIGPK